MSGRRKSTRPKKVPAYLQDYVCDQLPRQDTPPNTNPTESKKVDHEFFIEEKNNLITGIQDTRKTVLLEITQQGSRTRVKRLVERMSRDYIQVRNILRVIGEGVGPELRKMIFAEIDQVKELVEDTEDQVDKYLEARKDDTASELSYVLPPAPEVQRRNPNVTVDNKSKKNVTIHETKDAMIVEQEGSDDDTSSEEEEGEEEKPRIAVSKSQSRVHHQRERKPVISNEETKEAIASLRVQQEKELYENERAIKEMSIKLETAKEFLQQKREKAEVQRENLERFLNPQHTDVESSYGTHSTSNVDIDPKPPIVPTPVQRPEPPTLGSVSSVYSLKPLQKIVESTQKLGRHGNIREEATPVYKESPIQYHHRPTESSDELRRFFQGYAKPQVPKFSGERDKFQDWREQFELFINQAEVPVRYKMMMLKNSLSGKPLKIVNTLGYTESQYTMALAKLDQRYGGERRFLQRQMEILMSTPVLKEEDLQELEIFSNRLCDIVAKLADADHCDELKGTSALYTIVLQKIPDSLLVRYFETRTGRDSEGLATLAEWMNYQISIRIEMAERKESSIKGTRSKNFNNAKKKGNNKSTSHATNAKVEAKPEPSGEAVTSKKKQSCPLCKYSHPIQKCRKWTSANVAKRWGYAKEHNLCYRCLQAGHQGRNCEYDTECGIDDCPKTHHRHLHVKTTSQSPSTESYKAATTSEHTIGKGNAAFGVSSKGKVKPCRVGLRILPIYVYGSDGNKRRINTFLDDGSDSSYLSRDIAAALGLDVEAGELSLSTLTEQNTKLQSGLTAVTIESLDGNLRRRIGVRILDKLCGNLKIIDWRHHKEKWSHLENVTFPKVVGPKVVDLLIGSDHPELTLALEEISGKWGEPVARLTPLGWTCVGALDGEDDGSETQYSYHTLSSPQAENQQMDEKLRQLWNMDVLETGDEKPLTAEEKIAAEKVRASRKYHGDRYEVSIPWKEERPELPCNYTQAEKRLVSLEKSLRKKPHLAEKYQEGMQANIQKGYFEKLDQPDIANGWYLPHFPVVREDKETTKVRIVLDSAAKYKGSSLNDTMYAGPKLQRDIFDILIKFRMGEIAIVGDIKEMFSQVLLAEKDRPLHRILWRDLDRNRPVQIYQAKRLTFGDRASPFLAQYVLQSHAEEFQEEYPIATQIVLESIYMDDVIASLNGVEQAKTSRSDLTELLDKAGFPVRRWCSNNPRVLEDIPPDQRAAGIVEVQESELPSVKTLGILWNANTDQLGFSSSINQPAVITKRTLLSRIAALFDPLQLLAPFTIRAKAIMQQTWIVGLDWDEKLPESMKREAIEWFSEVESVKEVTVPRWYFDEVEPEKQTIHTFCDASSIAYAAVSYMRSLNRDGNTATVRIIAAKARVTPLKAVSIPRLELMAAVLGHRLALKIARLLKMSSEQLVFWSDSMDVIHWVRSQSQKYKPFVANRIAEIQSETLPVQWKHVPGVRNPADLATRGMKVTELIEKNSWTEGPDFLQQSPKNWPGSKVNTQSGDHQEEISNAFAQATVTQENRFPIDVNKFSSWLRLKRVTAWVLRGIRRMRREKLKLEKTGLHLSQEELEAAELELLKATQQETFSKELEEVRAGKCSKGNRLRNLSPFLDEKGLLRIGGRLQNSQLPYETRHPCILPSRHHVTTLVIRTAHQKARHSCGVNAVLADIRQRYWILHGREAVKRVLYECYFCRRMKKGTASQVMAPLPASRATISIRAFSRCGVDYAGPFVTKITRRVTAKRYLALFTCLVTRAIHLEMAYSLDTASFLLAFSRMIARRGKPEEMISDNGTNFVGANRELTELVRLLDFEQIEEDAANKGIKWKFGPPLGSHHGGVFEAMIKSAKKAINAILGCAGITDEELLTAIVETEGLLNSRPLTYSSSDPQDEPVLTPNHFLHGQCGGQLAPRIADETDFNPRNRWRLIQELVKQIWQRWMKEYLTTLQRREKWLQDEENLKTGDVVLIVDQNNPRGKWPLGKIEQVFPGTDGNVRTVKVSTEKKKFIRPITRLVPLVLSSDKKT